jgi:hypothetical protein
MIAEAARCGHDDLRLAFERFDLLADGRAAVETDGADARQNRSTPIWLQKLVCNA